MLGQPAMARDTASRRGKTEGSRVHPGRARRGCPSRPNRPAPELPMPHLAALQALYVSTGTVALAEIGDKTQLLALLLAARFRRPWPIVAGILVATLLNHALAAWLGTLFAHWLTPTLLRWIVAASFIGIALWTLKPDTMDESTPLPGGNVFAATVVAFFLAEIGDKTQVATVLLATRFDILWQVVAGTTVGMLLANVPVVAFGSRFAQRLPLRAARIAAAVVFLALGLWVAWRGIG
jgi:putative Ca2+/H+ antiporter (TMEM165/GDT1 family)